MKQLRFSYEMQIDFTAPVTKHRFTLKCIPGSNERQRMEKLDVQVYPNRFLEWAMDSFGNECIYGYCEIPHDRFSVSVSGQASTGLCHYETAADEYKLGMYKYTTHYTKPGPVLKAYYETLRGRLAKRLRTPEGELPRSRGNYAWALFVTQQLYQDFRYESGITGIQTTAEEALAGGKGVCQDYAHIMIALCHMAGVPARYVVGMLQGEGLSHAWVEIYEDGMWIGLDPTNNLVVCDQHIKISHGRDYNDCTINQGVFTGLAGQAQHIRVIVEEEASGRKCQRQEQAPVSGRTVQEQTLLSGRTVQEQLSGYTRMEGEK